MQSACKPLHRLHRIISENLIRHPYHWAHNYYSQLSYFRALIRITVTVTATIIVFPGIN